MANRFQTVINGVRTLAAIAAADLAVALQSPPPIGGTTPAAATFSSLNVTGNITSGGSAPTGYYLRGNGTSFVSTNGIVATDLTGTIAAARLPAYTGDATSSKGSTALTLATVNANVGTFGDSTHIPVITANAKGLVTAISLIAAAAGSGGGSGVSAFLDIGYVYSVNGGSLQTIGGSFSTLQYQNVSPTTDTANGWSKANNSYTIPYTGVYLIMSKLRLADNSIGVSFGQGVHTSNIDGPWFIWANFPNSGGSASQNRFVLLNIRIAHFNAGDVLHHYAYGDNDNETVDTLGLNIVLLIPG